VFKDKGSDLDTLRKQVEELERVFDSISDLIFIQDKDHTITKVNAAFAKALNAKPENLIGKKCYELLHKSDKPWPECPLEKTKLDQRPHTEEVNDPNIGIQLLVTTSPIFNDKKELVGAVHIAKDITERKQAEQKRKESDERFKAIFNTTFQFTGLMTPDGTLIEANQSAADFTGLKLEDVTNRPFWETHWWKGNEERVHKLKESIRLAASGKFIRYETELQGAGDTTAIFDFSIKPVFGLDGKVIFLVPEGRDITESKKMLGEIKDSEAAYRALYDSSKDAVMIVVPQKGFIAGNTSTIEMFRCRNEAEFITKSPANLSPELQPDGVSSMVKAQEMMRIAMEKGSHFFEWTHKRLDGEEFFATVLLTRVELKGEPVLQATVRDITEQKLAEAELKRRLDALERFQKITVDRELMMIELKKKIAVLEAKAGEKLYEDSQ